MHTYPSLKTKWIFLQSRKQHPLTLWFKVGYHNSVVLTEIFEVQWYIITSMHYVNWNSSLQVYFILETQLNDVQYL